MEHTVGAAGFSASKTNICTPCSMGAKAPQILHPLQSGNKRSLSRLLPRTSARTDKTEFQFRSRLCALGHTKVQGHVDRTCYEKKLSQSDKSSEYPEDVLGQTIAPASQHLGFPRLRGIPIIYGKHRRKDEMQDKGQRFVRQKSHIVSCNLQLIMVNLCPPVPFTVSSNQKTAETLCRSTIKPWPLLTNR